MPLAQSELDLPKGPETLAIPDGYKGLYGFHKYWGKKPAEPIAYLINHLSPPGGLVIDPFLGSGVSAIEAVRLNRRVIGIDLNPAAIRLTRMLVNPPSKGNVEASFAQIRTTVKTEIMATYKTADGDAATHYLWSGDVMEKIWRMQPNAKKRIEGFPAEADLKLAAKFDSYEPHLLRKPRFFTNSRINSKATFKLADLFTGRALHNIELILGAIGALPPSAREPLLLSLTAAVGQMSSMVFAISGRGKKSGEKSERIEVGSWVIGFWKPEIHFEVNAWNCFERRVNKLIKALDEAPTSIDSKPGKISDVCANTSKSALVNGDCLEELLVVPDESTDLIITDPPHGDRIPYLELSELWNVILGEDSRFESEIVVSNAKERAKTTQQYNESMRHFLILAAKKLKKSGHLVLFFNARSESSWLFFDVFRQNATTAGMVFNGCFPLVYSAGSVVQDNRAGALQTDYGLIFSRSTSVNKQLVDIPNWSSKMPQPTS